MSRSSSPKQESSFGAISSPRKLAKKLQSSAIIQGLASAGSSGIKTFSKSIPFGQKRSEQLEDNGEDEEQNDQIITAKQVDSKLSALDEKKRRREMKQDAYLKQTSNHTTKSGEDTNTQSGITESKVTEFALGFNLENSEETAQKREMDKFPKAFEALTLHATSERHLDTNGDNELSKSVAEGRRHRFKTSRSDRVLRTPDSVPTRQESNRKLAADSSRRRKSSARNRPESASQSTSSDQAETEKNVEFNLIKEGNESSTSESNLSVGEGAQIEGGSDSPLSSPKKSASATPSGSRRRPLLQARKEQSVRNLNIASKKSPSSPRRNKIKIKSSSKKILNDSIINGKDNDSFNVNDLVIELDDDSSSKQVGGSGHLDDTGEHQPTSHSENNQQNGSLSPIINTPSRRSRKPIHMAKERVGSSRGLHGQERSRKQDGDFDECGKQATSKEKRTVDKEKPRTKRPVQPSSRRDQLQKSISLSSIVELDQKPSDSLSQEQPSNHRSLQKSLSDKSVITDDDKNDMDRIGNKGGRRGLFARLPSDKALIKFENNNHADYVANKGNRRGLFMRSSSDESLIKNDNNNNVNHAGGRRGLLMKSSSVKAITNMLDEQMNFFRSNDKKEIATVDIDSSSDHQTKTIALTSIADAQRKIASATNHVTGGLLNLSRWKNDTATTKYVATTDAELQDDVIINRKPFSEESYIYARTPTDTPRIDSDDIEGFRSLDDGRKQSQSLSKKSSKERNNEDIEVTTKTGDDHQRMSKKSESSAGLKESKDQSINKQTTGSSKSRRKSGSTKSSSIDDNEAEVVADTKPLEIAPGSKEEASRSKSNRRKLPPRDGSRQRIAEEDAHPVDSNSSDKINSSASKTASRSLRQESEQLHSKDKQDLKDSSNNIESQTQQIEVRTRTLKKFNGHYRSQRHLLNEKELPKTLDENRSKEAAIASSSENADKEVKHRLLRRPSNHKHSTDLETAGESSGRKATDRLQDIGHSDRGLSSEGKTKSLHSNPIQSGQVSHGAGNARRINEINKRSHQNRSRRNVLSTEEPEAANDKNEDTSIDKNSSLGADKVSSVVNEKSKSSRNAHGSSAGSNNRKATTEDVERPKKVLSSGDDAIKEPLPTDVNRTDSRRGAGMKRRESPASGSMLALDDKGDLIGGVAENSHSPEPENQRGSAEQNQGTRSRRHNLPPKNKKDNPIVSNVEGKQSLSGITMDNASPKQKPKENGTLVLDNVVDTNVSALFRHDRHNCDDKSKRSRSSVESTTSSGKALSVEIEVRNEQLKEAMITTFPNFIQTLKADEKASRTAAETVLDPIQSKSQPVPSKPRVTRRQTISGASSPAFAAAALAATCIPSSLSQRGRQNGVAHRGLKRRSSANLNNVSRGLNLRSSSGHARTIPLYERVIATNESLKTNDRITDVADNVMKSENNLKTSERQSRSKPSQRHHGIDDKSQRTVHTTRVGIDPVSLSSKGKSKPKVPSPRRLHTQLDSSSTSLLYQAEFSNSIAW